MTISLLKDGFSTKIIFDSFSSVEFKAIEVMVPGLELGGPIDITNMYNTAYKTKAAKTLKDVPNFTATVAYDPAVLTTLKTMLGVEGSIQVQFPGGVHKWVLYGFLDGFKGGTNKIGERPTAEISVVVTNSNAGTETGPAYS